MRRILLTALASCVVLAAVPAIATAHSGEHHRGRHHERHHRRDNIRRHHRAHVRHEHFNGDRGDRGDNPGEEGTAGTVTKFTNGVLTITLNNGDVIRGLVTQGTELKCEMQEPEFRDDDQGPGGGDNGGGDNGGDGRGGPGPGDDHGDNDDQMCTTIAAGMMVERAELRISSAGAFWEEVELIS